MHVAGITTDGGSDETWSITAEVGMVTSGVIRVCHSIYGLIDPPQKVMAAADAVSLVCSRQ